MTYTKHYTEHTRTKLKWGTSVIFERRIRNAYDQRPTLIPSHTGIKIILFWSYFEKSMKDWRYKQNVLEANNHSRTKMFPLGVVVREKLPDLTVPLHRPSICLPARVHSIREQPLHVKPPILPVSLSPLLFQISSYLSQNLITMQKYEWDTAGSCVLSLTQRLYISNCNELLYFSKTSEE